MSVTAFIGLGSNLAGHLDSPAEQIKQALQALGGVPASRLVSHSSLYCSKPLPTESGIPQGDYINAVAAIDTQLVADALLDELQAIEANQQRVRGEKWGPRTLDLDLLLFGKMQANTPRLQIPHPGLPKRAFVLYPLAEIAPELDVPGCGPLVELLAACPRDGLRISENSTRYP